MPAYLIATYDVTDPEKYKAYVPAVIPLLKKHGAEVIVADYEVKPLEGTARGVNVVLRFESAEAAMRFYNDPAYAPVKQIRLDSSANGTMVLAKHYAPPPA